MALLLVPAGASADSPVLEFLAPRHSLPVRFTTESGLVNAEMAGFEPLVHCTASHGEGEITGPHSTVSEYRLTGCTAAISQKCKSATAEHEEEIRTGPIDAELVYIDQSRHEVGMLLNPGGGTYIQFECGGISAEGQGPFLAPVGPINQEATSFTATLDQLDSVQTPDEYEDEHGDRLQAIPTGKRGTNKLVPTGVEAAFAVHTSVPVEIKAVTAQEIEAKEAAKKQEEALNKAEEHAKQGAEEAKRHEAELNAEIAAIKKHQEEEAAANKQRQEAEAAKKKQEESKPPTRAQLLTRALRKCEKQPKRQRARCVASAYKKYAAKAANNARHAPTHPLLRE
jgi:hypothetical protein